MLKQDLVSYLSDVSPPLEHHLRAVPPAARLRHGLSLARSGCCVPRSAQEAPVAPPSIGCIERANAVVYSGLSDTLAAGGHSVQER
jgi:hypothetical protein